MVLLVLLVVFMVAPAVWVVVTLSAIRRNTGRAVELLERAQLLAPQGPSPWEPDEVKWQSLAERPSPRDQRS